MKGMGREVFMKRSGIILIGLILIMVPLSFIITGKKEYSDSERRALKAFPEITVENILEGDFMEEFELYTMDHFPFREELRAIKNFFSYYILQNRDNNGIYAYNGYLAKMEYPLEASLVEYAAGKMRDIYNNYLMDTGSKCYVAVIPDKNYYMAPLSGHLSMDYGQMFDIVKEITSPMKFIDLTEQLVLEDYYKTDTHWRQERLPRIAAFLGRTMGGNVESDYENIVSGKPFYGVYAGQWALPVKGEELVYLTNDVLENAEVNSLDTGSEVPSPLYDFQKMEGKDPYEMFLSGTKALLVMENRMAESEKELIIFRDSFGSSLAPLLLCGYKRITLVDIRYVQSNILEQFIDFKGQDVLFLYSSLILNNGKSLR